MGSLLPIMDLTNLGMLEGRVPRLLGIYRLAASWLEEGREKGQEGLGRGQSQAGDLQAVVEVHQNSLRGQGPTGARGRRALFRRLQGPRRERRGAMSAAHGNPPPSTGERGAGVGPVSYTHLTLPTNREV